jgi:hypothetical protein
VFLSPFIIIEQVSTPGPLENGFVIETFRMINTIFYIFAEVSNQTLDRPRCGIT